MLVEQNARAALELAHEAYVLEQGRIVAHDTGQAMLQNEKVRQAYLGYVAVEVKSEVNDERSYLLTRNKTCGLTEKLP